MGKNWVYINYVYKIQLISRISSKSLKVRVGQYHLNKTDTNQADISVSSIKNHEHYDDATKENDISILFLTSNADFGKADIGSIQLPVKGKEYPLGSKCVVTGWGRLSEGKFANNLTQKEP